MRIILLGSAGLIWLVTVSCFPQNSAAAPGHLPDGEQLFESATFGGNGRTCRTCHSQETGTVSPQDAQQRFRKDPKDLLFLLGGSDDGHGHGVTRMLKDATVLVTVPLAPNVRLADDPGARSVVVRRGISTTLNTPALDPVLTADGREPSLEAQAARAILDHAQGSVPSAEELSAIASFEKTSGFFSSPALRRFALDRGPAPRLPQGNTELSVGVSEFNSANNPVREFIFNPSTPQEKRISSPDPGRALITGIVDDPRLENVNAFKIPALRGCLHTAPYFHDNSAKTLEEVAAHYAKFFSNASHGVIALTPQDQKDIVAYMKLLD